MGNKVTITDLTGLSDYATSISEFVHQYKEQISNINRTFTNQVSGSEADAINAFFEKLNDLQGRVFEKFPDALNSYEAVVSTYHTTVSDLGFSRLVKSQIEDAEDVAKLLSDNQLAAIQTITASLKVAFDEAATAMGTTPESVDSINALSEQVLAEAASNRKTLGSDLDEAYRVFVDGLKAQTEAIKSLNISISNVAHVTTIPLGTVFSAIKSGTLTADEMYYFDLVSSKEDAKALEAIIGDNPGDIVAIDPSKISNQVYIVVANEINQWTQNQDIARLQQLITGMSDKKVEQNDIFTNNLLKAQDAIAISLFDKMYTLHSQQSESSMDEVSLALANLQMEQYQGQLDALNKNNSLLVALQYLKLGQSVESATAPTAIGGRTLTSDRDTVQLYTYSKVAGTITFKDGRFELNTETYYLTSADGNLLTVSYDETNPVTGNYDISVTETDFGASMGESSQRIQELNKERQKARDQMVQNIIGDITKTGISLIPYGPVALAAIELTNSLSEGQRQNLATTSKNLAKQGFEEIKALYKVRTGNDLIDSDHKIYEKLGKSGLDVSANVHKYYQSYIKTLEKIDQEKNEVKQKMYNKLVGQGATSLDGTELDKTVKQIHREHHHDFRAFLISKELDEYGLTKAIEQMKVSEEDLIETIEDKVENAGGRERITNYLLGKDSSLTLADLSPDDFDRLDSIVRHLTGDGWTDLGDYFNQKYGVEP